MMEAESCARNDAAVRQQLGTTILSLEFRIRTSRNCNKELAMKYVYEFIGTFFLVVTVALVIVAPGAAPIGFAPLAIGTVLAVMIFAGGHVSGGHYNPAVSLAVYLRGDKQTFGLGNMLGYWVVQLAAGFIAALVAMYLKSQLAASMGVAVEVAPIDPNAILVPALIAEFLGTFALTYTVLNVATAKGTSGNSFYGWAIGMAVLASAYAFGWISGGAFNPAVAVGITQLGIITWGSIWIYWVAQLVAGAVAALVFRAAHPGE
jgi:aquaporin Z